jgi:hypothetical protein
MGIIENKKKFKRKVEQTNPANPTGNTKLKNKGFDMDKETIREQQSKK